MEEIIEHAPEQHNGPTIKIFNFLKELWSGITRLDLFFKISLVVVFLLVLATPFIIKTRLTTRQNASQRALVYGINIRMCAIDPLCPRNTKNSLGEDGFDIAKRLGANTLLVWFDVNDYSTNPQADWDAVMKRFANNNMKAIIYLNPPYTASSTSPEIYSYTTFKQYIDSTVVKYHLGSYPALYAFDFLGNGNISDGNLTTITQARNYLKSLYPSVKFALHGWRVDTGLSQGTQTYRWDDPNDAGLLVNTVDYLAPMLASYDLPTTRNPDYSLNFMDPQPALQSYFDTIKKWNKPILVDELDAMNGIAYSDWNLRLGHPAEQANVFYHAFSYMNNDTSGLLLGANVWGININKTILPYAKTYDWGTWGILSTLDGNTIYPAGYMFQQFAFGMPPATPLPLTMKVFSLNGNDNGATLSVTGGDRIGIRIGDTFATVLQNATFSSTLFNQLEPLSHFTQFGQGTYVMFFQAKNSGVGTITFPYQRIGSPSASTYKVTVNVATGPTPTPTPKPNLIRNASFENELNYWNTKINTAIDAGTVTRDTTYHSDGATSLLANVTAANSTYSWYSFEVYQTGFPLVAYGKYTVSFWAKGDGIHRLLLRVRSSTKSTFYLDLSPKTPVIPTVTGKQYSFTFTPSISDSTAQIVFGFGGNKGKVWIDNVSLTKN